jgi:GTP pyrophosphokinase
MAVPGKAPEPILREGEGSACDDGTCMTLDGAFEQVKAAFLRHHPNGDVALLRRAYTVGRDMHATQLRKSGEPYFFHPLPWPRAWRTGGWTRPAWPAACSTTWWKTPS